LDSAEEFNNSYFALLNRGQEVWPSKRQELEGEIIREELSKNPPVYKTHLFFELMARRLYIYNQNYHNLHSHLIKVNHIHQYLHLMSERNEEELNFYLFEAGRLTHNYLSAAKMLLENTNLNVDKRYSGKEFARKYKSEKQTVFESNLQHGFVKGLRNYMLHWNFPLPHLRMEFSQFKEGKLKSEISVALEIEELLEYKKWNEYAKMYIQMEKIYKYIDLEKVFSPYHNKVNKFQMWISENLKEMHAEEIIIMNRIYEMAENKASKTAKEHDKKLRNFIDTQDIK